MTKTASCNSAPSLSAPPASGSSRLSGAGREPLPCAANDNYRLPSGPFDVIVADPPWTYYGSPDKDAAAGKHYRLMPDEELLAFPVRRLLNDRGVLFLWATSPRLDFALTCVKAWGLHHRGVAFVWTKCRRDGEPIGAQGPRPSIVKPTTEFVLAASPIARGRPMPLASESVVQTVLAPRGTHSAKPEAVQNRIETLYPRARRLELFARRRRKGWTAWGDGIAPD